jgi:hypothetical protein
MLTCSNSSFRVAASLAALAAQSVSSIGTFSKDGAGAVPSFLVSLELSTGGEKPPGVQRGLHLKGELSTIVNRQSYTSITDMKLPKEQVDSGNFGPGKGGKICKFCTNKKLSVLCHL